MSTDDVREAVRDRYRNSARRITTSAGTEGVAPGDSLCCEEGTPATSFFRNPYDAADVGDVPVTVAAASLGCANPLLAADLKDGETVLDLGSGGGLDVILSAKRVGPAGHAYGLDMTDEMLELGRDNARVSSVANVTFLKGDITTVPLPDASVDVVISNCVVNLAVDKRQVFGEALRVLRPGGRVSIADVVIRGPRDRLTYADELAADTSAWCSCIGGAMTDDEVTDIARSAGFTDVRIVTLTTYTVDSLFPCGPPDWIADADPVALREMMARFTSSMIHATRPL